MEPRSSVKKYTKLLSQISLCVLVKPKGPSSPLFLKASLISFFLGQTLVALSLLK